MPSEQVLPATALNIENEASWSSFQHGCVQCSKTPAGFFYLTSKNSPNKSQIVLSKGT